MVECLLFAFQSGQNDPDSEAVKSRLPYTPSHHEAFNSLPHLYRLRDVRFVIRRRRAVIAVFHVIYKRAPDYDAVMRREKKCEIISHPPWTTGRIRRRGLKMKRGVTSGRRPVGTSIRQSAQYEMGAPIIEAKTAAPPKTTKSGQATRLPESKWSRRDIGVFSPQDADQVN